jgi:hypothetical protein
LLRTAQQPQLQSGGKHGQHRTEDGKRDFDSITSLIAGSPALFSIIAMACANGRDRQICCGRTRYALAESGDRLLRVR